MYKKLTTTVFNGLGFIPKSEPLFMNYKNLWKVKKATKFMCTTDQNDLDIIENIMVLVHQLNLVEIDDEKFSSSFQEIIEKLTNMIIRYPYFKDAISGNIDVEVLLKNFLIEYSPNKILHFFFYYD